MRTPLYRKHIQLGARMVEFGGCFMPLFYSGIMEEHRAVRQNCGIFDLSHMGRIKVKNEALSFLQGKAASDVSLISPGRCRYSLICGEDGGIVDDIIICRFGAEDWLVVANAVNRKTVFELLGGGAPEGTVVDESESTSMIAVQGPDSADVVSGVVPGAELLKNYGAAGFGFRGAPAVVSRTGYTGEDGFEIIVESALCAPLWEALFSAGEARGIKPAGLGARDTLRLEAGMRLYGHELGPGINPFEAGLGDLVDFDKGEFRGRKALMGLRGGKHRKLSGVEMLEKAIPRQGCRIFSAGEAAGEITSGSYAPSLEKMIGMGYIERDFSSPGSGLEVEIRGRMAEAKVVELPFYRAVRKEGR